jgi:hypothetical protein
MSKTNHSKAMKTEQQKKVPTVTPDNDNGKPGAPPKTDSADKGKGPKGESLNFDHDSKKNATKMVRGSDRK